MEYQQIVDTHGFFFASNAEMLYWAQTNPQLCLLSEIFDAIGIKEPFDKYFFVPIAIKNCKSKGHLPLWIWRRFQWPIRDFKPDDLVIFDHEINGQLCTLPAKVLTVKEKRIEITVIGSHSCNWVNRKDIRWPNNIW